MLLICLATVGVIRLIFGELDLTNNLLNCEILMHLQLNEYETNPYFLQFFQSNPTVCLIIHVFCKSCEPEIVFVLICILAKHFHGRKSYKTRESTLLYIGNFEENMDLSHIYLAVISQADAFEQK